MFIRIFLWRFFRFVWLVSFFNHTHVAVPISLSPLVAFAPAGEERNGYQRKKRLIENKEAVDRYQRKKRLLGRKEAADWEQ